MLKIKIKLEDVQAVGIHIFAKDNCHFMWQMITELLIVRFSYIDKKFAKLIFQVNGLFGIKYFRIHDIYRIWENHQCRNFSKILLLGLQEWANQVIVS